MIASLSLLQRRGAGHQANPVAAPGSAWNPPLVRSNGAPLATVACLGKGGSGKSSTIVNLAAIAREAGRKVGIIDADPQQSSFEWRRARGHGDIPVCRCNPDRLDDAVDRARRSGLELLFLDMPPGSRYSLAAARCADLILIPTRPTLFDLKVTRSLVQLLKSTSARYAVVINAAPPRRRDGDAPMVRETRDALANIGARLWKRQITHRLAVAYAIISGAGVIETEPEGFAAKEYSALWDAVCRTLKPEGIVNETP
jgi:chromosome partitioning protein